MTPRQTEDKANNPVGEINITEGAQLLNANLIQINGGSFSSPFAGRAENTDHLVECFFAANPELRVSGISRTERSSDGTRKVHIRIDRDDR